MNKSLTYCFSAILLLAMIATPAFAQDNNGSAGESMHKAGESAKNAASNAGNAAVHAYHGTAQAVEDTQITARVKTVLHENKETRGRDIHVTTEGGVVTLSGLVRSGTIAKRAQEIAQQTTGVKAVKNDIGIASNAAE
jgi:osmotically-inducible protein OsmY